MGQRTDQCPELTEVSASSKLVAYGRKFTARFTAYSTWSATRNSAGDCRDVPVDPVGCEYLLACDVCATR
jgi:hypothetical protein